MHFLKMYSKEIAIYNFMNISVESESQVLTTWLIQLILYGCTQTLTNTHAYTNQCHITDKYTWAHRYMDT